MDLTLFAEITMDFAQQDVTQFPLNDFATRCAYREQQSETWRALPPRDNCIDAEIAPGTFMCCTDTIGDFGVQLFSKKHDRKKSAGNKDKFKGRLTIGPLFLVVFDLYLFSALFLGLVVWKTRQSFQLEFTGLYPSNEQKKEIKAQIPTNIKGRQQQ